MVLTISSANTKDDAENKTVIGGSNRQKRVQRDQDEDEHSRPSQRSACGLRPSACAQERYVRWHQDSGAYDMLKGLQDSNGPKRIYFFGCSRLSAVSDATSMTRIVSS